MNRTSMRVGYVFNMESPRFYLKIFQSSADFNISEIHFEENFLTIESQNQNSLRHTHTNTHTRCGLSAHQTKAVTVFDNSNKNYSFICFTSR